MQTPEHRLKPNTTAVLLCAGHGTRMGTDGADKPLLLLDNRPLAAWSAIAFREAGCCDELIVVCRDQEQERALKNVVGTIWKHGPLHWVRGGNVRAESALNGLRAVAPSTHTVLIHDAARPLARADAIRRVCEAASINGAAALARRVVDTIKETPPGSPEGEPFHPRTLDRTRLWAMETPQAFHRKMILRAYEHCVRENIAVTDDAAAVESLGLPIVFIENPHPNPKLTSVTDLPWLEFLAGTLRT